MSIEAISGVLNSGALSGLGGAIPTMPTPGAASADTTMNVNAVSSGNAFSLDLAGAIDTVQAAQADATAKGVAAVTGDLDDVHDYTIAAAKASTMLELTAAVRNKAVEAFNEIMRMQA